MCGNFNDETMDEYEGPAMIQYTRVEELIAKYVVPADDCSVASIQEHYGLIQGKNIINLILSWHFFFNFELCIVLIL